MGNRAVITTDYNVRDISELAERSDKFGIYVHWNGGLDSILAFLTYAKMQKFRAPVEDNYGMARLCQVIANYFTTVYGHDTSIGIDTLNHLDCDNGDNGVYLIDNTWNISKRTYTNTDRDYDLEEMLIDIDEHQPELLKMGKARITEWLKDNEPAKDLSQVKEESVNDTEDLDANGLLLKALRENEFAVELNEEDSLYTASRYTPAGEDWSFTFTDAENFNSYRENFDPNEEFDMLYRSGISGLPEPAELIEDQKWKQQILETVWSESQPK